MSHHFVEIRLSRRNPEHLRVNSLLFEGQELSLFHFFWLFPSSSPSLSLQRNNLKLQESLHQELRENSRHFIGQRVETKLKFIEKNSRENKLLRTLMKGNKLKYLVTKGWLSWVWPGWNCWQTLFWFVQWLWMKRRKMIFPLSLFSFEIFISRENGFLSEFKALSLLGGQNNLRQNWYHLTVQLFNFFWRRVIMEIQR